MITKGQWQAERNELSGVCHVVANVACKRIAYGIESESDAHLIAAAPAMLRELKRILKCQRKASAHFVDENLSALVAKAEGKTLRKRRSKK